MAFKIKYEIVRPNSLPSIHKLMYQSFWVDEPQTRHLELNKVQKLHIVRTANDRQCRIGR